MKSDLEIQSPACLSITTLFAPESNAACKAEVESSAFQPTDDAFTHSPDTDANAAETVASNDIAEIANLMFFMIHLSFSHLPYHNRQADIAFGRKYLGKTGVAFPANVGERNIQKARLT